MVPCRPSSPRLPGTSECGWASAGFGAGASARLRFARVCVRGSLHRVRGLTGGAPRPPRPGTRTLEHQSLERDVLDRAVPTPTIDDGQGLPTHRAARSPSHRTPARFFVATAPLAADGTLNVSPKGLDAFAVLDRRTVRIST